MGRSKEWAYLLDAMNDELAAAEVGLVNCDANDAAKVGRIQATIQLLKTFLDGDVIDGLVKEAKETEIARRNQL